MLTRWTLFVATVVVVTALKVLLIPSYHSTDFEVHRNWLAITYSLPPQAWYYEATSPWTLDYPPAFAAFEWAWAQVAAWVVPEVLEIQESYTATWRAVVFHRATVIVSDAMLVLGVWAATRGPGYDRASSAPLWVLLSPGLLIVDHIHFQYNGFLFGLLLLSIGLVRDDRHILGAICFSVLLTFKHLFLYLGPAFFVHMLGRYCFAKDGRFLVTRFAALGACVVAPLGLALGPFLAWGQAEQLVARMFPFKRGLIHAYWAPNAWALYVFADTVLGTLLGRGGARMTGGLVGEGGMRVLPQVPPPATFLLAVLAMLPGLWRCWKRGTPRAFVGALVDCGLASFLFGWHVHEKAILMVLIPMAVHVHGGGWPTEVPVSARVAFFITQLAGHFALFPLLYEPRETPIKVALLATYCLLYAAVCPDVARSAWVWLAVTSVVGCGVYQGVLHRLVWGGDRMAFLPLMLLSVLSALWICGVWVWRSLPGRRMSVATPSPPQPTPQPTPQSSPAIGFSQ